MQRGGDRYDLIFMGLLREEWEEKQKGLLSSQQVEQT
jgi:hypothetical protein